MIHLDDITSGYSTGKMNENFQKIEREFNEKTLRRDGLGHGEPNHMEVDLDMNSQDVINVGNVSAKEVFIGGAPVKELLNDTIVAAGEEADRARDEAINEGRVPAVQAADRAEGAADRAEGAADRAETASDAAFVNADVYPDVATGLAAVADGEQFQVVEGDEIVRYRRDSASTQTEVSRIVSSAGFRTVELSANRAAALSEGYPIAASASVADAGGSYERLKRILNAVVDIRLFGLPTTDSYHIERLRRNYQGNWHIVIKRGSDNASVLQFFGPLVEPADPNDIMTIHVTGVVPGAYGFASIRWGALVAGQVNTNLTIPVSRRTLDIAAPSFINTRPAYGARSTQIAMPLTQGGAFNLNISSMSVSWPVMDIICGESSSPSRYRLASGSITFSGSRREIAWLNLEQAKFSGSDHVPVSAVRVGTYRNRFERTADDYAAEPHQFPIAWSAGNGDIRINPLLPTEGGGGPPIEVVERSIAVHRDLSNNEISVYYPAGATKYIRVRLMHWVSTDADAWTIGGIWEVERVGDESFTSGKRLVSESTEILAAFQEQGAADFMGSRAHGDEVIVEPPTMLVDGKEVSMVSGGARWYHGDTVTLIQRTRMYRVGSVRTVPLIDRGLILEFRDRAIYADQRFTFLDDFDLSNGYAAMMAPHRYESYVQGASEDTSSAQISGKYIHNNAFSPKDVSTRQSSADLAEDYSRPTPRVNHVKLWGTYGVEFELEVIEATDILKDIFFIQRNNYAYNKAYIGFIGAYSGIQAVSEGDQWAIKTRMSIRSSN